MTTFLLRFQNRHFFLLDIVALAVIPSLALALRLDSFKALNFYAGPLSTFTVIGLIVRLLVFWRSGLYTRYWRYASVDEITLIILTIGAATAINTIFFFTLYFLPHPSFFSFFSLSPKLPRSMPLIDGLLTLIVVGGTRFCVRLAEYWQHQGHPRGQRVLIIGAGSAGRMIAREIQNNPQLGLEPVGFVDDDPTKQGMKIQGLTVLGNRQDIPELVEKYNISQAIIAMPSVPGIVIRETVKVCSQIGIPCRTIPGLYELLDGKVTINLIRNVQLDDLLRRDQVQINLEEVGKFLSGARLLITGAGGSIGSELCRQVALHNPELLILLGHGENSIFNIWLELSKKFPTLKTIPVIADIRDKERIKKILEDYQPTIIFHAAAHKHVPMMEYNPIEAITNNIIGTLNVAETAAINGLERFILISTDKAVNPTSFMGASKRVAELLIQEMTKRYKATFVIVRFGNVLGSRGSVVPLFQKQISDGGPVTVTHPEVKRFFMSTAEAVQLVIQAAAMGKGGEIFVLDMGEPIRILDIAQDLIRLNGLEPERDIKIVFTGLRPGEKLSEELFFPWENPKTTKHPRILLVQANHHQIEGESLRQRVLDLARLARLGDLDSIKIKIKELVPEFQPHIDESTQKQTQSKSS